MKKKKKKKIYLSLLNESLLYYSMKNGVAQKSVLKIFLNKKRQRNFSFDYIYFDS